MGKNRKIEIENVGKFNEYRNKIKDIAVADFFEPTNIVCEEDLDYGLPF